jgi:TPR repeat protein
MAEAERAYAAQDDAKALALFLPFARNGNRDAQFRVARIYSRERGVAANPAEACNWWEAAASQGEPVAATNFGLCHETGRGRPQSYPLAAQWYRRAADGGNAQGMYNLGLAYEYGRGVNQSFSEAASLFQRAIDAKIGGDSRSDAHRHLKRALNHVGAARGDPQALYDLAIDLFNGHPPEVKDIPRAVTTMREAAARGNLPEAWYVYGSWLQMNAFGVRPDPAQATTWIRKAADAGHEEARIRYANLLLCGIGIRKDAAGAERTLKDTIDGGSWMAMSELSQWYDGGTCGFRRDARLSAEWRSRADAAQRAKMEYRAPQRR